MSTFQKYIEMKKNRCSASCAAYRPIWQGLGIATDVSSPDVSPAPPVRITRMQTTWTAMIRSSRITRQVSSGTRSRCSDNDVYTTMGSFCSSRLCLSSSDSWVPSRSVGNRATRATAREPIAMVSSGKTSWHGTCFCDCCGARAWVIACWWNCGSTLRSNWSIHTLCCLMAPRSDLCLGAQPGRGASGNRRQPMPHAAPFRGR
mmetsp:Transcript_117005/g.331113  ORF Transcript_117005/g.331113 Transcript_117005/m.331113 type:complete len:203 (+) Transcript_117005:507-1115(+)